MKIGNVRLFESRNYFEVNFWPNFGFLLQVTLIITIWMGIFQPQHLHPGTLIPTLQWKLSTTVPLETITEEPESRFYQTLKFLITSKLLPNLCHPGPIQMLCSRDPIQCHLWCTDLPWLCALKKITMCNNKRCHIFDNNILYLLSLFEADIFVFCHFLTRENCTITVCSSSYFCSSL